MKIPFAQHAYLHRSLPVSAQQCYNLYPELQPPGSKAPIVLIGAHGAKSFGTTSHSGYKSAYKMGVIPYFIAEGYLYSLNTVGTATQIGFTGQAGFISMATNGTQLVMVDGSTGWVYSVSAGLQQITDPDFPAATSVDYLDNYFVFTRADSGQFFISDLGDGLVYDALDFATAEGSPDNLVGLKVIHREIWLFGEDSVEVWYNSGAAAFPFERITSVFIEKGCLSKTTIAIVNDSLIWLGDDLVVYKSSGYLPLRISTHAIDYAISSYDTTDCFAFGMSDEGHYFYFLSFPKEGKTWVYDDATGLWHERGHITRGMHRAGCYVKAYGKHLIGDYATNEVFELDLDERSDGSTSLRWVAASSNISNAGRPLFMSFLQIDMETGVGLTTGQGSDPQAMLDWSDDNGRTWSNEHWRSMGKIGEYKTRVTWRKLGRFYNRIFRVAGTDPVKSVQIEAYAELESG